jgi:hypothetical protein
VVAVVASAVALIVVFTDRSAPSAGSPSTPGAAAATPRADPPGRVQLRDDRSVVTLTWSDPTSGTVQFIVAGGRAGQQQRALAQIAQGVTRYEGNGLNPNLDYCFTVLAVYSADRLVPSDVVCTHRNTSPSAGASSGRTG